MKTVKLKKEKKKENNAHMKEDDNTVCNVESPFLAMIQ